ncbi:MAG: hypothetical protein LUQ38_06275 [Methanotrichaceae archaeon]|nr:hypothetical protein [Methanotrichaceae archaeon]MDD1757501.1 hypothetical protein [Methanotrichaceae archaeon]
MSDKIIEDRNLEHNYDDSKAVDDMSFDVCEEEISLFLGPKWRWQRTVVNVLITLLPIQKGHQNIGK